VIPLVSIRLKVGPKGQIVIPKVFREAYGIKEGGEVIVEPTDKGLIRPSDALHVAVIENNGLQAIVSEDEDFDVLPLKRLWISG